ncbi:hypothetical protein F4806DRAFT_495643 [Annulohypoxylon nitens]|nr:hypothetical protein F4806DRAFT_495643 [Annulohypoxylon nitens]
MAQIMLAAARDEELFWIPLLRFSSVDWSFQISKFVTALQNMPEVKSFRVCPMTNDRMAFIIQDSSATHGPRGLENHVSSLWRRFITSNLPMQPQTQHGIIIRNTNIYQLMHNLWPSRRRYRCVELLLCGKISEAYVNMFPESKQSGASELNPEDYAPFLKNHAETLRRLSFVICDITWPHLLKIQDAGLQLETIKLVSFRADAVHCVNVDEVLKFLNDNTRLSDDIPNDMFPAITNQTCLATELTIYDHHGWRMAGMNYDIYEERHCEYLCDEADKNSDDYDSDDSEYIVSDTDSSSESDNDNDSDDDSYDEDDEAEEDQSEKDSDASL